VPNIPFKNKQYNNSQAENSFREYAESNGWTVTKRGWPDFIVFDENGDFLFFVEVKKTKNQRHALESVNKDDKRKKCKTQHVQFQARTIDLLRRHGFTCKVWTPKDSFGE
jgi:Holliday junction resolvase-like predicted endonuclease